VPREKIILATKVCGFDDRGWMAANRSDPPGADAPTRLDAANIHAACNASLRRLQTNYIDLYQVMHTIII